MKKFGWCYLGAGVIAHKTAKELVQTNNRIVSVWNRTYAKAVEFAKEFSATAYENILDAINNPEVEGVYIATTNNTHYELMKICIEHHKSVLCEKPFAMNTKQTKEIFELAAKEGVYVSEAMWTWHNDVAIKVREWVKDNKLGNIKKVKCTFGFPILKFNPTSERLTNPNLLGGALLDLGVYGIRYSLELFGTPKDIECKAKLKGGVDYNEEIKFIYDNFVITHKFAVNKLVGEVYHIKGDKNNIKIPIFHKAKRVSCGKEHFKVDNLLYGREFENVAKEIRDGLLTSKFITKENTIKCIEIMDLCRGKMNLVYPYEVEN